MHAASSVHSLGRKIYSLISYKKGSKRTVWILVKLGDFVSIGSILLDIKCPLYEWIWHYKVPAFDTSVPMKLACYMYTVYHKLRPTVLLVYLYPIFPPIFHCAFLQNGLFFFFRFFPFFPLPVELELLFPPPPVLSRNDPFFTVDFST